MIWRRISSWSERRRLAREVNRAWFEENEYPDRWRHDDSWKAVIWLIICGFITAAVLVLLGCGAFGAEISPAPVNNRDRLPVCVATTARVSGNYLAALAQVESGGNDSATGRAGERGRYQFKAVAWRQANRIAGTRYPFTGATNRVVATYLAGVYLAWLSSQTPAGRADITVSPEPAALFCAWNLGPTGFKRRGFNLHRCPLETREAALRFKALVEGAR